jgi:hypothetical protein
VKTQEEVLAAMEEHCVAASDARQVLNNMIEIGQVHVVADVSPVMLRIDPEWDGIIFNAD